MQKFLNIQPLIDFANTTHNTFGRYQRPFALVPENLLAASYVVKCLNWSSIHYGDSEIEKIPDNKRGVYAFAIAQPGTILPPHGYILYIGMAGRDSTRSLRERYRDYLTPSKMAKRDGIRLMIGTWHAVLRFYFAAVDDEMSSDDLKRLEKQLNTALVPPYSEADIEAATRQKRRAFR